MRRRLAQLAFLIAALAALIPRPNREPPVPGSFPGWPETFEGRPLVETPLAESEARFDARFPGKIGRFRAGNDIVVMRWTNKATHRVHPLSVCLQASGWTIEPLPMVRRDDGDWSAFAARKGNEMLAVREQVRAIDGTVFADVEGWFWQALAGRTSGPWLVISVASRERP